VTPWEGGLGRHRAKQQNFFGRRGTFGGRGEPVSCVPSRTVSVQVPGHTLYLSCKVQYNGCRLFFDSRTTAGVPRRFHACRRSIRAFPDDLCRNFEKIHLGPTKPSSSRQPRPTARDHDKGSAFRPAPPRRPCPSNGRASTLPGALFCFPFAFNSMGSLGNRSGQNPRARTKKRSFFDGRIPVEVLTQASLGCACMYLAGC